MSKIVSRLPALLLSLVISPALAHVTLETKEARLQNSYKAVFRVPHGCAGSATTAIRVRIPDGVIAVKPMPKPGWSLSTERGKYGKTYDYYGTPLADGVKEVQWSGGKLLDENYDEFVLRAYLSADLKPGMLYIPVVQQCEQGTERWIEIPADGKSADDYKRPAPGFRLVPKD